MPRHAEVESETEIVSAWVGKDARRELLERANRFERPLSSEIRIAIRRHLAEAPVGEMPPLWQIPAAA